jgi:hypothetical protein
MHGLWESDQVDEFSTPTSVPDLLGVTPVGPHVGSWESPA